MAEFSDIEYIGIGDGQEVNKSAAHPGREVSPAESIVILCAGDSLVNRY